MFRPTVRFSTLQTVWVLSVTSYNIIPMQSAVKALWLTQEKRLRYCKWLRRKRQGVSAL